MILSASFSTCLLYTSSGRPILAQIREKDKLLSYPYESMRPFLEMLTEAANDDSVVSIDVYKRQVDVDLPGFKKDEIHLELKDGYLTISAEKSLEKGKENKQGKMLRQERYSGVMQRSFYVGEHLTEEDVKASYENGVLHIKFPKKEALKAPEKKTILIEG